MKNSLISFLILLPCLYFFYSCQRELVGENETGLGFIQKDRLGNCQPISVNGSFVKGLNLGDTNYIEVEVNVKMPGKYIILTDTLNGFYFKSDGNFQTTGTRRLRLAGIGKPWTPGLYYFTVKYDTSRCQFALNVKNNLLDTAVYTLQGSPGQCMNAVIAGNYLKGIVMDTSNKVAISLMVTSAGSYNISTPVVNGYHFSTSGTFAATGLQTVVLTAMGAPLNTGINTFNVTAGSSNCSFQTTVLSSVVVNNADYFPLTTASLWTYDNTSYPNDSVNRIITNITSNFNGNLFKVMDERIPFVGLNQVYFRKVGDNYYEYTTVDKYTNSFHYGPPINGEILFLKETLNTGSTWLSDEYNGTATFGQVLLLRYQFTCIAANAVVSINGNVFANVYKIKMQPQIKSLSGPWGDTSETFEYYYAKGVGLIYIKKVSSGFTQFEQNINRWQVN